MKDKKLWYHNHSPGSTRSASMEEYAFMIEPPNDLLLPKRAFSDITELKGI